MTPRSRRPLLVAAALALATASLGGALTVIGPWYRQLAKPWFQPPDWLFGPAWTLIFALCAVAGAHAWNRAYGSHARRRVLTLFGLNAVLNVGWSLLFFRLQRPDWALAEVAFLWLSILLLIAGLGRQAPRLPWLLAPYLAWVSFAAVLNAAIVRLNAPFG